ncbi:hypothetical protein EVAR_14055_1 [Eumeta japonica]|uniref:Uncharacterized protein n=1 Tax=Eumeta variegata TaxID=151549 RepID=A0A4C1UP84_EUMVA|nr:hypothetical protein EVAR_14055_1 [Eumeta japonica]
MDKTMKALKPMKVGKAAGYDRVSSVMLKGVGSIVASLLYQLLNKYCAEMPIGHVTIKPASNTISGYISSSPESNGPHDGAPDSLWNALEAFPPHSLTYERS